MFDVEELKKVYKTNMNCDLSQYGININDVDENGATYLHYACDDATPDISYIRWLISKSIDVNAFDRSGISPLYIAYAVGNNGKPLFIGTYVKIDQQI